MQPDPSFERSFAVGTTGKTGIWAGQFNYPSDDALGADGTFVASSGTKGRDRGQFNHAIAVAVTDDNTVFVADFGNNRIEKWRQEN